MRPQPSFSHPLSNLQIVLLCESAYRRSLLKHGLHQHDMRRIDEVSNVVDAIAVIDARRAGLVIIDLERDLMSGIEFTRLIRWERQVYTDDLPVIIISSTSESDVVRRAVNSGCNAFIVKPYSAAQLAKACESVILRPKPFIRSATYVGPDRRIKDRPEPAAMAVQVSA